MYLELGDMGGDGHEQYRNMLYEVKYPVEKVREAHEQSQQTYSVNFDNIAEEYEDRSLPNSIYEKFKELNCPILDDLCEEDGGYFFDDYHYFADLWWWFTKLSLPDLEYSYIVHKYPTINIYPLGYGLFL
jgi:hypothetical protein